MSDVDYCITTMDRPAALERLLLSVAARHPDASIHIADQSREVDHAANDRLAWRLADGGLLERPTIHRLPFDCGVSAARNHLMESTTATYKLLLDDDFVFCGTTHVDAMVRLLDAHPESGLVGGSVSRNGRIRNVGTLLRKRGRTVCQLPAPERCDEHDGIRFKRTDCVPVFALARRELAKHVRWDPALKTAGEHFDFFLRMQDTPYGVLYAPDVTIDHPPLQLESSYLELRWRREFMQKMLAKHGVSRFEALDGAVIELQPDGTLTRTAA